MVVNDDNNGIEINQGRNPLKASDDYGSVPDSDNDDLICDDGESCGAFPELDLPEPVTLTDADQDNVDFVVSFGLSTPTGQQASAERPSVRDGLRRLD